MNKKYFNLKSYKSGKSSLNFMIAILLGGVGGYLQNTTLFSIASVVSDIFLNLLRFVSLPIIFLSIISTVSGMANLNEMKYLAKYVVKYTLLTTVFAASCALAVFTFIDPTKVAKVSLQGDSVAPSLDYAKHLQNLVPSNFIQPFVENNVIGVLLVAVLMSLAILSLPERNREILHSLFSSLYATFMKITDTIIKFLPIAIWAFITLLFRDLNQGLELKNIALYLLCIVLSNLIQALVIIPAFLKLKGISPIKVAKAMAPALSVAFFTKSSNAALPTAMQCSEHRLGVSNRVVSFTFPLCTTINMNGCAAFILTTVLFVSMNNGLNFSMGEKILWIFMATVAAVGNAGVPMGCFFLASAFLSAMNVPLNLMGVILPFYSLIDMLETAINVWSDSSVAVMVDEDLKLNSQSVNQSSCLVQA